MNTIDEHIRLGYACINLTLRDSSRKICTNRTCRLDTAIKAGARTGQPPGTAVYSRAIYDFLVDYGLRNTSAILEIVKWHIEKGMLFYRMSSDIFPHIDNDRLRGHMTDSDIDQYRNLDAFTENLHSLARLAYEHGVRLTMHPSPFAVLGSPDIEKVHSTIDTLKWHARMYVVMEEYICETHGVKQAFRDSILCLHIGGKYPKHGGKAATLERWKHNFRYMVPDWVQRRIAIENCEKNYSVEDLLPVAQELNIPIIFDFHHYDCYPDFHKDEPPQKPCSELLPAILDTWSRRHMRPKFHLSDQDPAKSRGAHAPFVSSIPDSLQRLHTERPELLFDIMIEAKAKDYAVFYLLHKYPHLNKTKITSPLGMIPSSQMLPPLQTISRIPPPCILPSRTTLSLPPLPVPILHGPLAPPLLMLPVPVLPQMINNSM